MSTLEAIFASPDDDDVRLAYARTLGDDPRAAFILAQVRLGQRIDPARRRQYTDDERVLLRAHRGAWSKPVIDLVGEQGRGSWTFRRGFIDGLRIEALTAEVLEGLPTLFAQEPIRQLAVFDVGPLQLRALLEAGIIGRLRSARLSGPLEGEGLRLLADSPQLASLETLNVHSTDDEGVRALLASPHLRVTRLRLGGSELTSAAFARLPENLIELSAPENELDDSIIDLVLERCPSIRALGLRDNLITDAGARQLLPPSALPRLGTLELQGNEIGKALVEALLSRFGAGAKLDRDHKQPRRKGEVVVELGGGAPAFRGTRRSFTEWAAAVAYERFGLDLFTAVGWAQPEGAPCARCKSPRGDAVGADGAYVVACPTCRGGGVTLGPPHPWDELRDEGALARFLESAAAMRGEVLDAESCAAVADSLTELRPRLASPWDEITDWVIDGLRACWADGGGARLTTLRG